jgi:agmatinase
MSYTELFTSHQNCFGGFLKPFREAHFVVLGIPFDATSSYRNGARFGPQAIRQASLNIETYSFRSEIDLEDIPINDLGDLNISLDSKKTIDMCKQVAGEIFASKKSLLVLGGEHTITYGILKGLEEKAKKTALISFDAHLDLRKEFLGLKLSHATFMHKINEEVEPAKIIEVGTRGVCKDELKYAKRANINFIDIQTIKKKGVENVVSNIKDLIEFCESVYLSVDMDVLDPSFAPAVQNPEADGLSTGELLDIVCGLCDKRVIGADLVEIAPIYDKGISSIVAARIMFEMVCRLYKEKRVPT